VWHSTALVCGANNYVELIVDEYTPHGGKETGFCNIEVLQLQELRLLGAPFDVVCGLAPRTRFSWVGGPEI
jgi:hypothetical protein